MINKYDTLIKIATDVGCTVKTNEPMSKYTTFKVGGNAKVLLKVNTIQQLKDVVKCCTNQNLQWLIVGNGSNMLVSDNGTQKVVIKLEGDFTNVEVNDNKIWGYCGATLSKLTKIAKENSLSGLEFAFGIPGCVGGAVFMNAGAYGGEMKQVLTSITHITPQGDIETIDSKNANLGYRHSIYSENKNIIISATFTLKKANKEEIEAKMNDYIGRRKDKQPLEFPSGGSTFKRPEGYFAGALIEQCNLKGFSIGGAMVSEKHAGFVINYNNATCSDILNLINHIKKVVLEQTGVTLECEIKMVD